MIVGLLTVLALAFGGSTLFPPPASNWLGWLAVTAAGLLAYLAVAALLDAGAARRDARRRARLDVRTWRGL